MLCQENQRVLRKAAPCRRLYPQSSWLLNYRHWLHTHPGCRVQADSSLESGKQGLDSERKGPSFRPTSETGSCCQRKVPCPPVTSQIQAIFGAKPVPDQFGDPHETRRGGLSASAHHQEGKEMRERHEYRVSMNPIAIKVKLADLTHNMDLRRISNPCANDYARIDRYKKTYDFLNSKLL